MGGRKQILIAEDAVLTARELEMLLQPMGEVWIAPTCLEARQALKSRIWDLVVLDLTLADQNGMELVSLAGEGGRARFVMVITSDLQESTRRECSALGADLFFNKPFRAQEVREHAAKALGVEPKTPSSKELAELLSSPMKALSELLSTPVLSTPPKIIIGVRNTMEWDCRKNKPLIVRQIFSGDLEGCASLVLPYQGLDILGSVLGFAGREVPGLLDSALFELGNIAVGTFMGNLGNLLNTRIRFGLPSIIYCQPCERCALSSVEGLAESIRLSLGFDFPAYQLYGELMVTVFGGPAYAQARDTALVVANSLNTAREFSGQKA